MKYFYNIFFAVLVVFSNIIIAPFVSAQISNEHSFLQNNAFANEVGTTTSSSTEVTPSTTAAGIISQQKIAAANNDLTKPEDLPEKVAIITLFEARQVDELSFFNAIAYWVQETVRSGIPANTVYLILLTPILALLVSFVRVVIGLPTLDMLVPIALSFAFVAVGIEVGLLVLLAILFAAYLAKKSLSGFRIMFYPKRSLSMFFLATAVFAALTIGLVLQFEQILSLSIFPVLILMLLGDLIVSVQLHKSSQETLLITGTTIAIGLIGFFIATSNVIQNTLILYPELVLLVIPANILIGRYFGLRVLEVFRFNKVTID